MKVEKQVLNESKEKLPASFLTDFISRGWEDIGYLQETLKSIKASFSGTQKVEELLQALLDAYLVCVGQLELHLEDKDYLDIPEEAKKLTEDIGITVSKDEVKVFDAQGEEIAEIPVDTEEAPADEVIPPAEANIEPIEVPEDGIPVEAPIDVSSIESDPFEKPFNFDAPEAENVRPFEKPDLTDYFVDFDDPVGEPVTEKELYGEGEEPIENEKIDDGIPAEEEKKDEE